MKLAKNQGNAKQYPDAELWLFENYLYSSSALSSGSNHQSYMPQACNFIKKETLAQLFPCEFCEISKNTFFYKTPPVAASDHPKIIEYIPKKK